ncbi:MAG TPA: GntR family transcriptional regulator [Acetobacteraceae bacterium]|nr:GntR family transcriptional regulator [Acetobacteraceae bacterium]
MSQGSVRDSVAASRANRPGNARARPASGMRAHSGFWAEVQNDELVSAVTDAIAAGRLTAGTKLGEEELGALFGLGRTRVRQALRTLAFAGLVQLEPNRGAFVACPSLEEAEAVYAARRLIEGEIVREATRHCTANDIRRLRAHCAAQAAAQAEQPAYLRLLSEFHLLIAEIGGNMVLAELLSGLVPRTALMQALYQPPGEGGGPCAVDHHLHIIQLMAAGDTEGAAAAMAAHLTINLRALDVGAGPPAADLAAALGVVRA